MSASILDPAEGVPDEGSPRAPHLTESFSLGDWSVEPTNRCARNGDNEVKIDPRNMRVLQILAERRGQVVSPREIESLAWEGVVVTPDSIYQSIRQLRQALGDTKSPPTYIETVPRKGYRLVAEVRGVGCSSKVDAPGSHKVADPHLRKDTAKRRIAVCACLAAVVLTSLLAWIPFGDSGREEAHPASVAGDVIGSLEPSPDMDVQMLRSIALIERERGRPNRALPFLEQALRKQIVSTGERNQIVVDLLGEIANTQYWLGNDADAVVSAKKAKSILDGLTSEASPERISIPVLLAEILIGMGEYSEAEDSVRASVELTNRYYGPGHPGIPKTFSTLATLRHAQGNFPDAERAARAALRFSIEARGANDFRVAHEGTQLSTILVDMGRYAEAEREARQSISVLERSGSESHPYLLSAKHALSEALVKLAQLDEAEALLRAELAKLTTQADADWRIGRAATTLAEALLRREDLDAAERYIALAEAKLRGSKGWPAERELRNLLNQQAVLAALRSNSRPDELLSSSSSTNE